MDKKTVFVKTPKGESEMSSLSGDMKRVMLLIDDRSTLDAVTKHAPPSLRGDLPEILQRLLDAELIRDKDKQIAAPKITAPKIANPKIASAAKIDELDFTSMVAVPRTNVLAEEAEKQRARQEAEAKAKKEAEAARARAELEAAVAAAKLKASAEAQAKAEAIARQEAEIAARAKAEADARAKHEAAERQIAEAKAKQELEARTRAEQEAARVKAELEAAAKARAEAEARARAEIEAAARAKQEAEARARQEAEAARVKAEQEAARIKAELEAAARAKAEAEAARRKAEEDAVRAKAELEAARARAEAEAKALAEERARQEAAAARVLAEQEAARIKAEHEAALLKAKLEAEERALVEAEALRLKTEQEAHANAEALARQAAQEEAARISAAEDARLLAQEQAQREAQIAKQTALSEAAQQVGKPAPAFQINLDNLNLGTAPLQSVDTQPAPHVAHEQAPHPIQEEQLRADAEARAEQERKAKQNAAAEMARLKAEQEAARIRAEQEAKAKEEEQALAAEQADAWAEAEQRAKLQAKLDAEQAAQQESISHAKAAKKPVSRAQRKPLPLGKIAVGLLVLAIVAVFVLPLVWPMQDFIAPIERRLSTQLKQPVKIGGMSAALLPLPKIELQKLSIGAGEEIKITHAVLHFDALALLSENKAISNADLEGITLDGKRMDTIAAWLKGLGGDAQYPLRHLTIQNLQVNTDGISLPALKGSADFAQGAFSRITMYSEDNKFNVELLPVQNRLQLNFSIKERALPLLPNVMFSDFSTKGEIADGEYNFTELEAHAYTGIWSGRGKLNWRKGWQVQGLIQAKTMELEKMFPQFGLSGEVFVDGTFNSQSGKLSQLGDSLRFECSFSAKKGVITGMDMVETARLSSREHLAGGRTHFDDLTGTVQVENHNRRFRQIRITSGMLSASGSFDVTESNQLSGSFNSEIKMRAGNNPLLLSGTLSEPKLVAR